jgi:hypothetical protein
MAQNLTLSAMDVTSDCHTTAVIAFSGPDIAGSTQSSIDSSDDASNDSEGTQWTEGVGLVVGTSAGSLALRL